MSLNGVNTNVGAMTALQSLSATNAAFDRVRSRVSTGLKVASVRDDGATWAIAQTQRAEQRSFDAVIGSIQRGQAVIDVAIAAGETIADILPQMKQVALHITSGDLPNSATLALTAEYFALRDQIDAAAAGATFDGMNLISGGGSDAIRALAGVGGGSTIDIAHEDLSTSGAASQVLDYSSGYVTIGDIDGAIASVGEAMARLGTGAKALETHLTFVRKQQDAVEVGVGRLVDADLARDSALFQSLQVKQQLAVQALGIANRSPSSLIQLFQ
jgi:flagellin